MDDRQRRERHAEEDAAVQALREAALGAIRDGFKVWALYGVSVIVAVQNISLLRCDPAWDLPLGVLQKTFLEESSSSQAQPMHVPQK